MWYHKGVSPHISYQMKVSQFCVSPALFLVNNTPVPTESGWAPEPLPTIERKKFLIPARNQIMIPWLSSLNLSHFSDCIVWSEG